jgi:hypothetical protein
MPTDALATGESLEAGGVGVVDGLTGAESPDSSGDAPYLKTPASTYKTQEDALKGFTALESELRKRAQSEAEAKKRADELERQLGQQKVLEQLVSKVNGNSKAEESEESRQARLQALIEEIDASPGKKTVELFQQLTNELGGEYKGVRADVDEAKKVLAELKAYAETIGLRTDTVYQQNAETIDAIASEYQLPRQKAIDLFKKLRPEAAAPEREWIPGTTGGGRTVAATPKVTAEDREYWRGILTEMEVKPGSDAEKALIAKWTKEKAGAR